MFWRRRSLDPPEGWEELAAARLVHFDALDGDERDRLGADIGWLLGRKRWEATRDFELTEEICLTIAAQAALLVLGLDVEAYREVSAIVVGPTTSYTRGERAGPARGVVTDAPMPIIGQAHDRRGPVLIAWDAVRRHTRHPERGHNVVFHEFAHKLDMLTGTIDGTPPLPDQATVDRWVAVCTDTYRRLRAGRAGPLLDPYAGTNPGEFFAVATEVFFDRPIDLRLAHPDLYGVLTGFYRQDPAARVETGA